MTGSLRRMLAAALTAGGLIAVPMGESRADPIAVVNNNIAHFRDVRGDNNAGFAVGDRLTFFIDVTPNPTPDGTGDLDTRIVATQGAVPPVTLTYLHSPALPNQYAASVPCDPSNPEPVVCVPALAGTWTLTITNPNSPNSPVVVMTPSVGAAPRIDHLQSMRLTAGPTVTRPTFRWTLPPSGTFQRVSLLIMDLDVRTPAGLASIIDSSGLLPLTTESYTVPKTLSGGGTLQEGGRYAVSIRLDQLRDNGTILSRSQSFFNFTPTTGTPDVVLPSVSPEGVFHFRTQVIDGEVVFIDPPVAVGYDYATAPGDPNFASVILPAVGDGIFSVRFLSNGALVEETVRAGEQFVFPVGGVATFGVRRIEASAGLDPANPIAFVTGLTFVADGTFTGTMTPVVLDAGDDPTCAGLPATIFVRDGRIVGGPDHGQRYRGVLNGTSDDDVIVGTAAPDLIKALAGHDTICGLDGGDVIDGGDGDDWIDAGRGNDQIKGGRGRDTILGGEGNDIAEGGPGDDWIDGGPGNDRIKGQEGNDKILGGEGDDIVDGGPGDDDIDGGPGHNSIKG